jgi:hypothetical protein
MSYRQVSQEYGDTSDDEGVELAISHGPRHLGPTTALDRLSSASPTSRTWQIVLFLGGLVGVYLYGVHEGKVSPAIVGNGDTTNDGDGPFKTFHQETPSPAPDTPSPVDASSPKFTLDRLHATRTAVESLLSLLESYYTNKEQTAQMLLNAWTDPWDFDTDSNTPNSLRTAKLVDTMARALVTDDQDTFLMGGIGSSVMAGHDNCHYDAYQNQMERTFGGIWEEAGMKFVFQNGGEGGGCGDR